MQLASRGDYERHRFSPSSENEVEPVKDEPKAEQPIQLMTEAEPEQEAQKEEQRVQLKAFVKQFPQPPNTPKDIDHVKHIMPWLKQRRVIYGLWAASALIFAIGAGLSIYNISQNQRIIEQVSGGSDVAGISNGPSQEYSASEEHPDLGSYFVDPNKPRYISIPKYNVKGRVVEVGVTETNNMDVPETIYDGGWYNQSIVPGSGAGAAVINGHVSGYTQTGIFYNLKDLVKGDQVTIEKGDGTILTYQVVKTKTIAPDNFNVLEVLNPALPGTEALNLITCGGSFDNTAQNYTERVLVFTKRM